MKDERRVTFPVGKHYAAEDVTRAPLPVIMPFYSGADTRNRPANGGHHRETTLFSV
ncbi:hypothetical protein [Serratia rubidaea]|uniref:hypothetical protein n=1 Tax=Serratia rubidaea TaxID=61652 RepID=UPI001782726D|nr:hypothetical protein [Serratia rubidaea]MBD8453879.1 hypothetical protein [Serratia rubidaea]